MHLLKDLTRRASAFAGGAMSLVVAGQAMAQELEFRGAPTPGGMNFQEAATSLADESHWIDHAILYLITGITIFVTALLIWTIVRYNRRANPTPSRFTHNSPLEVAWTIVPIFILIAIGSFTVPALFRQQIMPDAEVTIKVTGYQWYWGYEYVDHGVEFESNMIGNAFTGGDFTLTPETEAQLVEAGYDRSHFLLATDTQVVVPVGRNIVMQVTAGDVIHSWTIPAFGVKQDGVPGRLAELWFNVDEPGIYFGQCSELCGLSHAYMPITVRAVPEEDYIAWLQEQGAENVELALAAAE